MNNLTRLFRSLKHVLIERSLLPLLRCLFDCLIGFVFVQIPLLIDSIINPDEFQKRRSKQQRIRSKLTDESDRKSAYRAIEVLDQLQNQPEEQIETLADIPRVCLSRFADKETMGIRPIINVQQEKQPNGKVFKKFAFGEYQFSSYRQICHRIDLIGRGLLSIGVEPGDRILIFSETRPEWLMTAFAGFTHRFTVVTLIPTLDQQGVLHGIQESNVKLILTSQELFNKLNKIINQIENQIEHIVYFPARADIDSKAKVESEKIEMIPLDKLEQIGKNAQLDENLLKQRPKKEDLAVIMYTSGSTGPPKGTSIRHENIIAAMTGQKQRAYPIIDVEHDVFICYLPLGHIFELCCEILIFYLGVKSGYGTPQTLASESTAVQKGQQGDLQALRPHLMGGVPTIFERMHQAIYGQIKQSNIFLRLIFDFCFAIKRKRMEYGLQTPILDRFLFSRFNKKALGGRLKVILSGGAILSEETQRFAQCALCVQVLQGYGLTETCGGGTIADHQEIDVGRAGYPIVSAEIRLIDWEEGQYRTTDKPNPRGEILIGGKIVADSYFGDAQEENDNFKEIEGIKYFYTGDIGQIFPDGTIQIIDRKKDVVKIQNGEYVSLAKVEMSIKKLLLVDNCCVCASDEYNHTVALIVPNTKEISSYAKKHFNQDDWKQIANDEDFNDQIRRQIHDACKTNGIQNYEIPKSILIVTEPWSPESGLVNDALKLKRKAIQQHYKQQIEQLYKGNIQQQQDKKQK